MSDTQIAAGWYPDPAGDQTKNRYWDGQNWTDQLADVVTPPLQAAPVQTQPVTTATYAPAAPLTYTEQFQQQQQAAYQQQPVPGTAATSTDKKGLAIASLVLALLGLLGAWLIAIIGYILGTLAVIFGVMGRKSSMKSVATAGLIIGIVVLVLSCISSIIGIVYSFNYLY